MSSFQSLPDDMLRNILQYLNGKELAQCGTVCRRFFEFTGFDAEWKLRCERDWNILQLPQNFTTWKECYVDMYGRFGPYLTCYKRVSMCWEKIFAVTQERCPPIYASLRREGTDEATLRYASDLLPRGTKLPLDYRCSYRLCNGQRIPERNTTGGPPAYAGLFGAYRPNDYCSYMGSYLFDPNGGLRNPGHARGCCLTAIYITQFNSGNAPLVLCIQDPEWNCQNANHERLNGSVVSPDPFWDVLSFIYGNSFIDFLENFADRITRYPVVNHRFLLFDYNAECDTGPFTITVQTMFDQKTSGARRYSQFHFRCRITMRMHPDAPQSDSCQLETCHWIITDADGKAKTVEGPNVVGDRPVVRPGTEFTWTYRTCYPTPTGKMSGYFKMRKLNTGGEIRINCPEFHLAPPPYCGTI